MANFYAFYPPVSSSSAALSIVTGSGTAGTPAPGVVTVQGIAGGTTLPVTASGSGTAGTSATGVVTVQGIAGGTTLPVTASGSGAAGTPATGVVTVQGIAGGTAIPVSTSSPAGGATSYLKFLDYAVTPITTLSYVQLTASTASIINWLSIFDSSGSAMILAVGAAASEIDQLYVPPGGSVGGYAIAIPAGSRISYKALDNNASSGNLIITGLV